MGFSIAKMLRLAAAAACLLTCVVSAAQAQSQPTPQDKTGQWHWRIEPYMMFPNMNGKTGIEGLMVADVDANVGDIFSRLQFGAMLSADAYTDKWAINSDFLFMNLKQDVTPSTLISSGKVNMKQLGWELAGFRRINPWLEVGIGGLLNSLDVEMTISRIQIGGGQAVMSNSKPKPGTIRC